MITREQLQIIEQETKALFEKLEAKAQITAKSNEDQGVSVDVKMEEPQMFIGENGQALSEIQHILRAILRKKLGEPAWVLLDINEYRKSKETYLRELASTTADEVALLHKEKELPFMNAQDRRVIHMVVSARQDVASESIGEEPERRVVIKPASGEPKTLESAGL